MTLFYNININLNKIFYILIFQQNFMNKYLKGENLSLSDNVSYWLQETIRCPVSKNNQFRKVEAEAEVKKLHTDLKIHYFGCNNNLTVFTIGREWTT